MPFRASMRLGTRPGSPADVLSWIEEINCEKLGKDEACRASNGARK